MEEFNFHSSALQILNLRSNERSSGGIFTRGINRRGNQDFHRVLRLVDFSLERRLTHVV